MSEVKSNDYYGTRDVQEYLLKIMIDVDKFCRENDIRYSLSGGTLLGAVRHKGFIPWDDDVDIMFDRNNYEKFMNAARERLPGEYTIIGDRWIQRVTRKDNPRIKQEEGCIDLFVLDHVPDNKVQRKIKEVLLMALQGMLKKTRHYDRVSAKWKFFLFITFVMGKLFSTSFKQKLYTSVSKIANKRETKYINVYNTFFKSISGHKFPAIIADDYTDIEFEGSEMMTLKVYEPYLIALYGDYMTPPPESERKPLHLKE